jgi:hypothetical protein
LESDDAVGLNKELVAFEVDAETVGDLAAVIGSGGTGGSGVLGAEDEYGVSGRELELGRVRVDASEAVDSVNEPMTATEGWMTGNDDL